MAEPTIFDICFGIDVHVCCLEFLVQFYCFAVLLRRLSQNRLLSLFLNLFFLTFFCANCWIDFDFHLWLIPVSLSSFLDMSWFDPCLCGLSAAFACSSGSLLALDARLGLGGALFFQVPLS